MYTIDFLLEKVLPAGTLLSCVVAFAILAEALERWVRHRVNHIQGSNYKTEVRAVLSCYSACYSGSTVLCKGAREWLFFARLLLSLAVWLFLPIAPIGPFVSMGGAVLSSEKSLIYIFIFLQMQAIFDVVVMCSLKSTFYRLMVYRAVTLSVISCFLLMVVLVALSLWFNSTDLLIIKNSSIFLPLNIFSFCITSFTLLCKNSLMFFDFAPIKEDLNFYEYSAQVKNFLVIKGLTQNIDRVFLCALLVVLFFDYNVSLSGAPQLSNVFRGALFLCYSSALLVSFLFLSVISPLLKSSTCLFLFKRYMIPIASIIVFASIIKLFVGQ